MAKGRKCVRHEEHIKRVHFPCLLVSQRRILSSVHWCVEENYPLSPNKMSSQRQRCTASRLHFQYLALRSTGAKFPNFCYTFLMLATASVKMIQPKYRPLFSSYCEPTVTRNMLCHFKSFELTLHNFQKDPASLKMTEINTKGQGAYDKPAQSSVWAQSGEVGRGACPLAIPLVT